MSEPVGDRRSLERLPGGGYVYALLDEGVRIEVRHLRRSFQQLHAEVDVCCDWAGAARHGHSLHLADVNLSRQSERKALATHCRERAKTRPDDFD